MHPDQITVWAVNRPVNASVRAGIFDRIRRFARSAIAAGSIFPSISASSTAQLDWPMISVATEDSLIPASSRIFSRRWIWRTRSTVQVGSRAGQDACADFDTLVKAAGCQR